MNQVLKSSLRIFAIALFFCIIGYAQATNLSQPYTLTRSEWLQQTIYIDLNQLTDLWKLRVSIRIGVAEKEQKVNVVITTSNGQEEPNDRVKEIYIKDIKAVVYGILQRYSWAEDLVVDVIFV